MFTSSWVLKWKLNIQESRIIQTFLGQPVFYNLEVFQMWSLKFSEFSVTAVISPPYPPHISLILLPYKHQDADPCLFHCLCYVCPHYLFCLFLAHESEIRLLWLCLVSCLLFAFSPVVFLCRTILGFGG